jgi:hypothetical protein
MVGWTNDVRWGLFAIKSTKPTKPAVAYKQNRVQNMGQ